MVDYLCISATFLDRRFHGRRDGGIPEWPPSPLRLIQAIVAANAAQPMPSSDFETALNWLERQSPPTIVAPAYEEGASYYLSVPNNAMDLVARAWIRGTLFGSGEASPATHRTMKAVRPIHMLDGDTVYYLWSVTDADAVRVSTLQRAAKRLVAVGWGIDLVVGHAQLMTSEDLRQLSGEPWRPTNVTTGRVTLRVPVSGTLRDIHERYDAFVHRIGDKGFVPVRPLTEFRVVGYRRATDPLTRPFAIFELRHDDGSFCTYPQGRLVHIAGMVRHLAIERMTHDPPGDVSDPAEWLKAYVRGRVPNQGKGAGKLHRQFSYVPLPSIGHRHTNPAIRRVMIAAPLGDDRWLEHLAQRLAGQQLVPERGDEFGAQAPPTLFRIFGDNVSRQYSTPSNRWASVTPVILPGHDDRKPAKTRKLIEATLKHSGIEQTCTYEWSTVSRFRQSLSVHDYDRPGSKGRRIGYIKPPYLQHLTAVHLTLRFSKGAEVSGPLIVGAGRHCGFGLMAPPPV